MKPDDIKSYKDLAQLNVPRLRELAVEDTELTDAAGQEKPALLEALAKVYGFEHPKQIRGEGIKKLKGQMKSVKLARDEILGASPAERDRKRLDSVRKQMKQLKRQMRKLGKAG